MKDGGHHGKGTALLNAFRCAAFHSPKTRKFLSGESWLECREWFAAYRPCLYLCGCRDVALFSSGLLAGIYIDLSLSLGQF